jgi:formylmethanofuran dehydrogenase subunit D
VVSICFLNTVDMMMLGIENGARVMITSPTGHVVLSARLAEGVTRGEIFVAIGPYANHIISSETHGTGMPDFKSQYVDVEVTEEPVRSVGELMEEIGGLRYDCT